MVRRDGSNWLSLIQQGVGGALREGTLRARVDGAAVDGWIREAAAGGDRPAEDRVGAGEVVHESLRKTRAGKDEVLRIET